MYLPKKLPTEFLLLPEFFGDLGSSGLVLFSPSSSLCLLASPTSVVSVIMLECISLSLVDLHRFISLDEFSLLVLVYLN